VHGAFDFGIYNRMNRKCELKLTRAESISKKSISLFSL
jgi:hypothetical protein